MASQDTLLSRSRSAGGSRHKVYESSSVEPLGNSLRPSTALSSSRSSLNAQAPHGSRPLTHSSSKRYTPDGRGGTIVNAQLARSPSLTTRTPSPSGWSGISFLKESSARRAESAYRSHPVISDSVHEYGAQQSSVGMVGMPSQAQSLPPAPSVTNASDRNWHSSHFGGQAPAGRADVRRLRQWLEASLAELAKDTSSSDVYSFSEQALNMYNFAFQELTRQVAISCVERGRLMADVWTSNAEMTGRLLTDLINQREGSERAVAAMQQDNKELQAEVDSLRARLRIKEGENAEAVRRLKALEELSLRHKYKGESWEEQETEWQKLEALSEERAKARAPSRTSSKGGGIGSGLSFFSKARLQAVEEAGARDSAKDGESNKDNAADDVKAKENEGEERAGNGDTDE